MATSKRSTLVGVFENHADATRAADELERAGVAADRVGYTRRGEHTFEPGHEPEGGTATPVRQEAETGARETTGAIAGAAAGGLLGAAAALLIPGIGPAVAGGVLATALGGAAAGAAAGGLVGVLTGMGVSEEEAHYYDREFQSGRTIMTIRSGELDDEAGAILRRHGAYDYETAGSRGGRTTGGAPGVI